MEMRYCRRCGKLLSPDNGYIFKCERGHTIYLNPTPGVGIFLFDSEGYVLLSVRGVAPLKGSLDCFGGFVDGNESLEHTLERELHEELQLEPSDYSTPEYLTSATSQYEYGGETSMVLSTIFVATLTPGATPVASDDVASIYRAQIEDINPADIGGTDIKTAFKALKRRYVS